MDDRGTDSTPSSGYSSREPDNIKITHQSCSRLRTVNSAIDLGRSIHIDMWTTLWWMQVIWLNQYTQCNDRATKICNNVLVAWVNDKKGQQLNNKIQSIFPYFWEEKQLREKGRDLTQPYDENPYFNRMSKGQNYNTNNATKKVDYRAVADRLRTVQFDKVSIKVHVLFTQI